jgi:hypothetical protein
MRKEALLAQDEASVLAEHASTRKKKAGPIRRNGAGLEESNEMPLRHDDDEE